MFILVDYYDNMFSSFKIQGQTFKNGKRKLKICREAIFHYPWWTEDSHNKSDESSRKFYTNY